MNGGLKVPHHVLRERCPQAGGRAGGTQTTADCGVKVRGWFDNEWGFSNRLLDVARLVGERSPVTSRRVSWSIA